MKYWMFVFMLCLTWSCTNDSATQAKNETESAKDSEKEEPMQEGLRNKRGYPIGTVEQARQLLDGAKAKRREIARRNKTMIENPQYGELIKSSSKKMDNIRPKMDRLDDVTEKIISGERVDFLSDEDLGKIQYRQQSLLDALIDSLSYLNSQLDQVLGETDRVLMEQE